MLDFGISKLAHRERDTSWQSLTGTHAVIGSPLYMSPEQLQASKLVDARSDVWSLGVILYELLLARTPFKATTFAGAAILIATANPPSLRAAQPTVPIELERIVQRCLQKDPAQRFQAVESLAIALEPFAGVARSEALSHGEVDRRSRRCSRWLALFAAAVAAFISPSQQMPASKPMRVGMLPGQLPAGWVRAGSKPQDYEMGLDTNVFRSGSYSGYIKSKRPSDGFGTLMQDFSPEKYLGKRLKFSAYVKTHRVSGWAGLWMRVDNEDGRVLRFDNMNPRSISGTNDWKQYSVVLDIPEDSALIACGLLVSGAGTAWLDGLQFEIVDETVATISRRNPTAPSPIELN